MKKTIIVFILTIVLILASTSIVSADPPPGVGPAVRVDGYSCGAYGTGYWYDGQYYIQYSNSKTGHFTFKCKMDFVSGTQQYTQYEYETDYWFDADCYNTVSLEGEKAMWTAQCVPHN